MNFLWELFFPTRCPLCGSTGHHLCPDCFSQLQPTQQKCPICCQLSLQGFTHPRCKQELALDRLASLWSYRQPQVRKIIKAIKYQFNQQLVSAIFKQINLPKLSADIIVPLPLHPHRQNWRGFNQAELISQSLSSLLNISVTLALTRSKNTKPLSAMNHASMRRLEIKDAFVINQSLEDKVVILVDDVFTSGSTMNEAASTLKKAGAKKVVGWTLAN